MRIKQLAVTGFHAGLVVATLWLATQVWFDFQSPQPQFETAAQSEAVGDLLPINSTPTLSTTSTAEDVEALRAALDERDDELYQLRERITDLGVKLNESEELVASLRSKGLEELIRDEWNKGGDLGFLKEVGYSEIELLRKLGYFEVRATINGENAYYLLDTGAAQSIMGSDQLERFEITLENLDTPREYIGLGGRSESAQVAVIDDFQIGEITYGQKAFSLVDLSGINDILEKAGQYPVNGLIGDDMLGEREAVIDYRSQKLYLKTKL